MPLYRHRKTGVAIPVTLDIDADLTTIGDDALARALSEANSDGVTKGRIRDVAAALRAEYTWEPRLSPGAAAHIIRKMFARVPEGARLFFLLPCEWVKWNDAASTKRLP